MTSNVEQRLLALEQGLLRVAALEQSHAQIAQLHEMVSACLGYCAEFLQMLTLTIRYKILSRKLTKMDIIIPRRSRKSLQKLVERLHLHRPRAPKKFQRLLKRHVRERLSPLLLVKVGMANRIRSSCSLQGWSVTVGIKKCEASPNHFLPNLTPSFIVQAVVASLTSAPKIELHHKAVLGRLAYEIKLRQQCTSNVFQRFSFFAPLILYSHLQQVEDRKRTRLSPLRWTWSKSWSVAVWLVSLFTLTVA
jgi:hypothetical protein